MGRWVTVNGRHVYIEDDGTVKTKGPKRSKMRGPDPFKYGYEAERKRLASQPGSAVPRVETRHRTYDARSAKDAERQFRRAYGSGPTIVRTTLSYSYGEGPGKVKVYDVEYRA